MTANRSSCTYDCQPMNNNAAPLVSESPELVEVLQKIVRNTAALLEMQDCVIALQDARGTTLVTYAVPQGQARNPLVDRLQEHEFFFSSRRRHTRLQGDWSSDVCSSD